MRRIRRVAAAVAAVGAVSGCSVYQDFTTSDFAKQDADAIVAAAGRAMEDVTSMRLTGPVRDGGTQYFIDLTVDREGRCTGTFRFGRSHVDVRGTGDRVWLKGESGVYNRLVGTPLPDDALRRVTTSWLLVKDDRALQKACDLDTYLESFAVLEQGEGRTDHEDDQVGKHGKGDKSSKNGKDRTSEDDLSGDLAVTVGEETDLADQTVVTVTCRPGGTHEEVAWVLSEAPHYVVKVESTSAQDGGTLSLSEFNEDVEVDAPDPKDVLRP